MFGGIPGFTLKILAGDDEEHNGSRINISRFNTKPIIFNLPYSLSAICPPETTLELLEKHLARFLPERHKRQKQVALEFLEELMLLQRRRGYWGNWNIFSIVERLRPMVLWRQVVWDKDRIKVNTDDSGDSMIATRKLRQQQLWFEMALRTMDAEISHCFREATGVEDFFGKQASSRGHTTFYSSHQQLPREVMGLYQLDRC
ncbi:hypothetical protein HAX54_010189 [Datura stramonium]|uniref:Uncharacterized protein n=1 Tax=Datura stramonium TaxID=4076 RepID=A0ABS8THR0_DATST|nr:hypothetical protein [Datura stramonium]